MSEHIKIAARSPRKRYRADGTQRVFAFDFAVFRPEDVGIGIDGTVLAGGYTVAIGPSGAGAVTLDTAPPDGAAVVVQRRLVLRRETDFQEGGELRAKTLNDELDFQAAGLQQVAAATARALHLPDDDPDDGVSVLPRAALRAHRALVFDADGNPAVSADAYVDQAAASAASAAAAAISAAGAAASAAAASSSATAASASADAAGASQALGAVHLAETTAHAAAASVDAAGAQAAASAAASSAGNASASAGAADASAMNAAASASAASGSASGSAIQAASSAASAVNAANSALSAAASALAVCWTHAASLAMADPGAGGFRFDAASPAAAGTIAVSALSADAGNPDMSDFVALGGASTNPAVKGTLVLRKRGAPSTFAAFAIQSVADNGTWLRIAVVPVASAGSWSAGDVAHFGFACAGDKGLDGAGTVVSVAAGDASIAVGGTSANRTVAVAANGVTLARLAREGAAGQVLTSNGAGADPSYQSLPAGVPAGTVVPYAGAAEPAGWLFAAGQAVSRTNFAALFAAIGTTFGVGDGSTTFNLPDLRGRVAAGRDNMNGTPANRLTSGGSGIAGTNLGSAGGSETHALTAAQMPSHTHGYSMPAGGAYVSNEIHETGTTVISGSGGATSGSSGSGAAHPNAQPTLVLNHIVKT